MEEATGRSEGRSAAGAGDLQRRVLRRLMPWLALDTFVYFLLMLPMLLGLILVPFGQLLRLGHAIAVWRREARKEETGDEKERERSLVRSLNQVIRAVGLTGVVAAVPILLINLPGLLGDLDAYSASAASRVNRQLEYLVAVSFLYGYVRAYQYLGYRWALGMPALLAGLLPMAAYAVITFVVEGREQGFPNWFLPELPKPARWLLVNAVFIVGLELLLWRHRKILGERLLRRVREKPEERL